MWLIEGSPHHPRSFPPVLQAFSNVPFPVGYLGWLLMFHAGMPGWWGGRAVWTVKPPSEAAILPAGPRFPQRVGDDEAPSELGHRVEVLPGRWRNIQVSRTHTHTHMHTDSSLFLLLFTHLIKSWFCLNISKTCLTFTDDSHFRLRKKIFDCRLWPLEIMRQKAGDAKLVRWFCIAFFAFSQPCVYRVITVCVLPCLCVQQPEENPEIPFHGLVFVDVGRLLYPGVSRIRGAYSIQPFIEAEMMKKVTAVPT